MQVRLKEIKMAVVSHQDYLNWERASWSKWLPLNELNLKTMPEYPGVYKIGLIDHKFPRLLGTTNIIYIGCTEKRGLKKRINGLLTGRHVAYKRIKTIKDILKKEMEFQFKVTMNAEYGEREAIEEYYLAHLELPPCNHAKPK